MSRESKKVGVERLNVDREVDRALSAVDEHLSSVFVSELDHVPNGVDGSQHIGKMGEADDAGAGGKQRGVSLEEKLPFLIHRDDFQGSAFLLTEELPGDDICVVLHGGDENFIPR